MTDPKVSNDRTSLMFKTRRCEDPMDPFPFGREGSVPSREGTMSRVTEWHPSPGPLDRSLNMALGIGSHQKWHRKANILSTPADGPSSLAASAWVEETAIPAAAMFWSQWMIAFDSTSSHTYTPQGSNYLRFEGGWGGFGGSNHLLRIWLEV